MSKQKIIKYIPEWKEEWHPPGYNWNGPYTQNLDRMSLNYKGKIGTESYFLPANVLDMGAFKHDLLYFSPSIMVRALADKDYYEKDIQTSEDSIAARLSKQFIYNAYISRITKKLAKYGLSTSYVVESLIKGGKDLFKIYKSFWIPTGPNRGFYLPTKLFGRAGIMPYKNELNNFFERTFGQKLTTARGTAWKQSALPLLLNIMGAIFLYGSKYAPEPITDFSKYLEVLENDFKDTEEYKYVDYEVNKVVEAYNKYLKEVGYFDNEGNFNIIDNIDESKAKREYINYYKASKEYFDFINNYYEYYPDFTEYVQETFPKDTKFNMPKLNTLNLDMVVNPVMKKHLPLTTMPNLQFEVLPPFPTDTGEEDLGEYGPEDIDVEFFSNRQSFQDFLMGNKDKILNVEVPVVNNININQDNMTFDINSVKKI